MYFDDVRTTITIDDETLSHANRLFTGMKPSDLINKALKDMVAKESAKRLADLMGCDADAYAPARRTPSLVADDPVDYNSQSD